MTRYWQGPITLEGVQTGDGRIFVDGAFTWAPLPLPLAWLSDGDQHVSMTSEAPQIGTIDTIERRDGGVIWATGTIDDAGEDGAEVIRRMDAGTAPFGNRFFISVDPDDWQVEIVDAAGVMDDTDELLLVASGAGPFPTMRTALAAASGDGDPEGEVLMEDASDAIVERYTRARIRGATLCSVPAFDGAWIELTTEPAVVAALVDPYPPLPIPARPPAAWFTVAEPQPGDDRLVEQPDGSWACPLTITDDGQVYGHIARWSGAHRGLAARTTPPRSASGYQQFHTGIVECDDGTTVHTGALVVGGDHADLSCNLSQARDAYAASTLGFADGRMVDGEFGPWFCGALRPGVNEADLRVLRSLAPSGDWRADPSHGGLELITALMVNVPGFPVMREALMASARLAIFSRGAPIGDALAAPTVCIGDHCTLPATAEPGGALPAVDSPVATALVAAGMVTRCAECAERARQAQLTAAAHDGLAAVAAAVEQQAASLRRIEAIIRHLEPSAVDALVARMHPPTNTP